MILFLLIIPFTGSFKYFLIFFILCGALLLFYYRVDVLGFDASIVKPKANFQKHLASGKPETPHALLSLVSFCTSTGCH